MNAFPTRSDAAPRHGAASWLAPAAYAFLVMAGITLGRSARDSLLLLHPSLGIGVLPWMYMLNAVFGVAAAAAYAALSRRLPRGPFAFASLGAFAAAVLGARLLVGTGTATGIMGAYVLVQAVWVLGLMQAWTLAAELFDPREAKRTFPRIGAGALVGMVVAGFGAKPLVARIGTESLFWVWLGIFPVAAAVLAVGILPRLPAARPGAGRLGGEAAPSLAEEATVAWKTPLLRALTVLTFCLAAVFTVVDYQFNVVARAAYASKDDLTAFMGVFRGVCGFGSIIFQFLVTPHLVRFLGVGRAIVVHPAFLVLATGSMTASFGFWTATVAKGGDHVLLYTVQDTAYNLLFNAVPPALRARARGFVEGTVKPVGQGSGGLLLVAGAVLFPGAIPGVLLAMSVVWFVAALFVRAAYVEALVAAIREDERPDAETAEALRGPESLAALRRSILSADAAAATAAIEVSAAVGARELRPEIHEALRAFAPRVRGAAVEALGLLGEKGDLPRVLAMTGDLDTLVRRKAIEAAGVLGGGGEIDGLVPFVQDKDLEVRTAAIVSLIRIGGLDGILAAAESLGRMVESGLASDRATAAKILGEVRVRHFIPSLLKLLEDSDTMVRRRAVRALGKIGDPRSAAALVRLLGDPHLGPGAQWGLIAGVGREAVGHLVEAVRGGEGDARARAAEALARIGGPAAEETLQAVVDDKDPRVRDAALGGLAARLTRPLGEAVRRRLSEVVEEETRRAYRDRWGRTEIRARFAGRRGDLLVEVVSEEERASIRRAFLAVGLLRRPDGILGLWSQIGAPASAREAVRARSLALEAFENLGDRERIAPLLPLLEGDGRGWTEWARRTVPEEQRSLEGFLDRLSRHPTPIVRAAVGFALASKETIGVAPEIAQRLRRDEDPLVRSSMDEDGALADAKGGGDDGGVLTAIEKILFLREVPIFRLLRREDLGHVASIGEEVTIAADRIVFTAGEPGDALYLIVEGRIRVTAPDGREIIVLETPECFGEMAILDDEPRSATAATAADAVLLRISRDDFRELIFERPGIAFGLFKTLTSRLRSTIGGASLGVPTGVG